MSKRNNWQKMLKQYNEALKPFNIRLEIIPEDNTFTLKIHYYDSVETYACGYYEDELEELIFDAYCYVS